MKKILVVDDSATVRAVIKATLTKYSITEAVDGKEALEKIVNDKFELIITDLHMPKMNGCELATEIRKTAGYRFTPILMLTTDVDAKEAKKCGASAWLAKPFKPDQINAILNIICPP